MFGRTRSVLKKILSDLNKVRVVADLCLQAILVVLCGYNIYINVHNIFQLVVYSLLLPVSVFWFIFIIVYYSKGDDVTEDDKVNKNKTANFVRYIKLGYRLVLIVYALVDVLTVEEATRLSVVLVAVSLISFILQVLLTVVLTVLGGYVELLSIAFEEDVKPISKFVEKTNNVLEGIKHPIYGISNIFVKEEQEQVSKRKAKKLDKINELNQKRLRDVKQKNELRKQKFEMHKKDIIDKFKKKFSRRRKNIIDEEIDVDDEI